MKDFNIGAYNKTLAAVIIGLIGWASAVVTSDRASISASEYIMLATALATALGVYSFKNDEVKK